MPGTRVHAPWYKRVELFTIVAGVLLAVATVAHFAGLAGSEPADGKAPQQAAAEQRIAAVGGE